MAFRKNNTYKYESGKTFKLSRSGIDSFIKCQRCFYLNKVGNIKDIGMPGFSLNSAHDDLMKKELDIYREKGEAHPYMESLKRNLIPFKHEKMEDWRNNFKGVTYHHKKTDLIIDFTIPKCTLEVLKIASKLKKKVVIGTTGFSRSQESQIKKYSKKIPILKAGNMSLGVNLLMYLTEIASKSLNENYLSKIFEVHHKHKKDYPSGTALMLGKGIADGKGKNLNSLIGKKFLNKKSFPYGKKINFNSVRKGEVVGEHEVKFSSGKEIITLNHEAFDRALYSEGALTAAKWLMNKKSGLYSMRDVLNFK